MDCPHCQRVIPRESVFCLYCGARLAASARAVPVNGGGTAPVSLEGAAAPAPGPPAGVAARPTAKRPYTLSFRALGDERVRYRVARWVCEVAPVHALDEVQQNLRRGEFTTFLALTIDEVAITRRQVEALGVPPALVHLVPATHAEILWPRRAEAAARSAAARWTAGQALAALGAGGAILLALGWALLSLYGTR